MKASALSELHPEFGLGPVCSTVKGSFRGVREGQSASLRDGDGMCSQYFQKFYPFGKQRNGVMAGGEVKGSRGDIFKMRGITDICMLMGMIQ